MKQFFKINFCKINKISKNQMYISKLIRKTPVLSSELSFFFIFIFFAVFLTFSCKSSKPQLEQTPEGVFSKAMEKFNNHDWIEASQMFDMIKLQFPASQYADDAQYYLAEIGYKKGEYYLAAFNYNLLRRTYPTSEYFKTSLYKAALCYYELSPSYERDQEYTIKAINTFQDYQRLYPNDSFYQKSNDYIQELRDKLAEGNYRIAELYNKLMSYKSVVVYLDVVMADFQDTKFFEPSFLLKAEALVTMKKYDEAGLVVSSYKKQFPTGKFISDMNNIEISIKNKQ